MNKAARHLKISLVCALLVIGVGFLGAHFVSAQTINTNDLGLNYGAATGLGATDIRLTVAKIIRAVLGFLGIVAVLMILFGGFQFLTAGGNEEKVTEAKKILINGVIGLVIILSAFSIASFVISKLVGATTGVEQGGGGGEGGGGGGGGFLSNVFYVSSLPQAGSICIRNINLLVIFNKEVDLATLGGNVVVQDVASSSVEVPGAWKYGGTKKNMAIFTPSGTCAPSTGNDCYKPNATYNLVFKNAAGIKTLNKTPELTLNCQYKAGCGTVSFKSGLGVDRLPPTVSITYPATDSVLQPGTVVPVKLHYSDDNGVQNLALSYSKGSSSSTFVDSVSFSGCKQSADVTVSWPTSGITPGTYTLSAIATDWAGLQGAGSQDATLRPAQCFNQLKDANEEDVDCGGTSGCGLCQGGACSANNQCASGTCANGICRNVMRIDGFSPGSGAPGTYVTISGRWFGEIPGKVYFATTDRPVASNPGDWKEAKVVNCGNTIDNWSDRQILVEVPAATPASSPIKVEAAPVVQNGVATTPVDVTSNHNLPNFVVTTLVRPGICSLNPNNGQSGDLVAISGKNFGTLKSASDDVTFGTLKAVVAQNQNGTPAWAADRITVATPALAAGLVGVTVTKDGVPSNSVRFSVSGGATATEPFISSISPGQSAAGDYITIVGGNFGDTIGTVWFKATPTSPAIIGSFNFPKACQNNLWSDKKIIVKFPANNGTVNTAYLVQINTSNNRSSVIDNNQTFTLQAGEPSPGICSITPLSGPVPFPAGQTIKLSGEYFLTNMPGGTTGPLPTDVYFWSGLGNPASITGRPVADRSNSLFSITTTTITVRPPDMAITGPVSVYRGIDKKISNPVNFNVADCRVAANQCVSGSHCCLNGDQAGFCKLNGELCAGETRSSGYVWRFSTKDLPPVPRVVERCDAVTESGAALPTPTPSVQWDTNNQGDHHAVCSNALVVAEFSTAIDQATVNSQSVVVSRCTSVDIKNNCVNPVPQALSPESYQLAFAQGNRQGAHSYLELKNTSSWSKGIWYQVILKNKIRSAAPASGVSLPLSADKPCGGDSAYCFVFQGGGQACVLNKVVVTPYSYLTELLEAPMRRHTAQGTGAPVDYIGNGLSSQRCIMMDVSGYSWGWKTGGSVYADIYNTSTGRVVNVSAKGNTVGVGIPNDAVFIQTTATTSTPSGSISKSGQSPLTIDLTNPEVVDYWPKCMEACTNADVAVQFNVSLSTRNIDRNAIERGVVKLNKCNDENCLSVTQVGVSSDVVLDPQSPYTVLHLANSADSSYELEANQIYQMVVSAVSTDPNATTQIWSRARSSAPASFSKPYNQEFIKRFKTKKDKCIASRVSVAPAEFIAVFNTDRQVYSAQPFSSPDACSAAGQRLNPWKVNWDWNSTAPAVATVTSFDTKGQNNFCTAACIKKGSTISSVSSTVVRIWPVCGNGNVEAGEDCDPPGKAAGCGLDCRWLGRSTTSVCGNGRVELGEACDPADPATKIGCSANCLRTGSFPASAVGNATSTSICGNGTVGSGEDCDLGITGSLSDLKSALGCSAKCLHQGTHLTSKWCVDNAVRLGDFGSVASSTCLNAYSQCGDGVPNPEEDPGCDLGGGHHAAWCNDFCLVNDKSHPKLGCIPNGQGCDANAQYLGSSLAYNIPSVCGDGFVGIGEDQMCETGLTITHDGLTDPWSLAIGIGKGIADGTPSAQRTDIMAVTTPVPGKTVSGAGKFIIACGYKTDSECVDAMGNDYGVAADSCCYARPRLVQPTIPAGKTVDPVNGSSVCINTAIQATFDQPIDPATVTGNLLIAQGISANDSCPVSTGDVTSLIVSAQTSSPRSWFRNIIDWALTMVRSLFGEQALAKIFSPPAKWCVGQDLGTATVTAGHGFNSVVSVALVKPLAPETNYAIILKPGIKNMGGVSIGLDASGKNISWKFDTRSGPPCLVDSVAVEPSQWYFSRANATTTLTAFAHSSVGAGATIQSLPGFYSWDYVWEPTNNASVKVPASQQDNVMITSNAVNGEATIRASAHVVDNVFTNAMGIAGSGTSHVVVFLCENPWPPKDLFTERTVPLVQSNTLGTYTPTGVTQDIAFSGKYAYVVHDVYSNNINQGILEIVSFADPVHPTTVSSVVAPGWANGVTVAGDYAYVTYNDQTGFSSGDIIKIINIHDAAHPVEVTTFTLAGKMLLPAEISVVGDYAYALLNQWTISAQGQVLQSREVLQVININNPAQPVSVALYPTLVWAENSGVASGHYFYIFSNDWSGSTPIGLMTVIDVSDPAHPTKATLYQLANAVSLAPVTAGRYIYVEDYTQDQTKFDVEIIDISDPLRPVLVGSAPVNGSVQGISASGNFLDVIFSDFSSQYFFNVFDIHDPSHPTLISSKPFSGSVVGRGIYMSGDYSLFISSNASAVGGNLEIFTQQAGGTAKEGPFTIFPYEDASGNNDAFDFGKEAFTNTAIPPSTVNASGVGDGYYNFSTYYCADSGGTGTIDDLPYLRPAVQTTSGDLQIRQGSCEFTGTACQVNGDCENYYQSSVSFTAPRSTTSVCGGTTSTVPLARYYLNGDGDPLNCGSEAECSASQSFSSWKTRLGITTGATCLSLGALPKRALVCYRYPPLKRFIFTNKENSDAIGIQVFSNPRHLTPEEWYTQDKRSGGQGFQGAVQTTKVDGYTAASDGNNMYISALNYSTSTGALYDLIYLLSINNRAKPEMRQVFDAFTKNFRLTTNLTSNDGYCGATISTPDYKLKCQSDLDCPSGQVCAAQVEKLRRDYQRIRDLKTIDTSLESYAADHLDAATGAKKYPDLKEGTYLMGQTISAWSSWSVLGQAVGQSLPADPINQLGRAGTCTPVTTPPDTADIHCARGECQKPCLTNAQCGAGETCTLHDATTGWSVADRRFSFACATSSYAYRYIYSSSAGYSVRSNVEDIGVPVRNLDGFLSGFNFSDLSRFNGLGFNGGGPGICNKDQEVVTINKGTCGDRQVNVANGEQCDPPGTQLYSSCVDGTVSVETCNAQCQWIASSTPTVACSYLSTCGNGRVETFEGGNGRVETGEVCDDGGLNGKYNHCNTSCNGKVAAYVPANPSASPGYCGDGQKNPTYELCDNTTGQPIYATTITDRNTSCSADCQSYGPYCGDGVVQTANGEECDPAGDLTCTDAVGNRGAFVCSSDCKKSGGRLSASDTAWWWKFNDLQGGVVSDATDSHNHPGACIGACPVVSSTGKFGKAYQFNPSSAVGVKYSDSSATSSFSFGFWIKWSTLPPPRSAIWKSIIGDTTFKVEIDSQAKVVVRVEKNAGEVAVFTSSLAIPINQWGNVLVTYNGNNLALYLDKNFFYNNRLEYVNQPFPVTVLPGRDISIGHFDGLIDEVTFYNRALTDDEIAQFGISWCVATPPVVPVAAAGICGNGIVDTNEACDNGVANNGIACTPSYGKPCSYCSADCKNKIDVQPTEYCGDGIIEPGEACDTDANGVVFAKNRTNPATTQDTVSSTNKGYSVLACASEPPEPNVFKKGTKICANNCSAIVMKETNQASCVKCGIDTDRGVVVKGSILNVLEATDAAVSKNNPLYVRLVSGLRNIGSITLVNARNNFDVLAYAYQDLTANFSFGGPSSVYTLQYGAYGAIETKNSTDAPLATDSLCYAGDSGRNYMLSVNNSDPFLFPIKSTPDPWQYDFLVSPIISTIGLSGQLDTSQRPNDIRVVVSWVGENIFDSGFVKPITNSPTIESLGFGQPPTTGFDYYTKPYNNPTYSAVPGSLNWNIWYHGRGQTPGLLSEESFTVDSGAMQSDAYVLYVRTEDGSAIKNIGRTAKLRVDIYLPKTLAAAPNYATFTQPDRSFQFVLSGPSDNPGASYWEVLKIQKTPVSVVDRIQDVTVSLDNGRIVTGAAQF